jgi:hypothetical protein
MCSLGLRMIVCESVEGADGVFVLTSDPTIQCGESPQLWLLHIAGGCLFFGMPLPTGTLAATCDHDTKPVCLSAGR